MADITYIITIKKAYASAIIEDLKQVDAIEIIETPTPDWQQKESERRLNEMKSGNDNGLSEEEFFNQLNGGV